MNILNSNISYCNVIKCNIIIRYKKKIYNRKINNFYYKDNSFTHSGHSAFLFIVTWIVGAMLHNNKIQ